MSSLLQQPCSSCARIFSSSTYPKTWPGSSSLTCSEFKSQRTTSTSAKKNGALRYMKPKETVAMFRTSVQNLSKSEWKWSIDVSSILKTAGSLNLDLPKSWTAFLPTVTRVQKKETEKVKYSTKDNNKEETCVKSSNEARGKSVETAKPRSKSIDRDEIIRKHRSKLYDENDVPVIREQHDFFTAMSNVDESIRSYNMQRKGSTSDNEVKVKENAAHFSSTTDSTSSVSSVMSKAGQTISETWKIFTPARSTDVKAPVTKKPPIVRRKNAMARASINRKTRHLVTALKLAGSNASKLIRLEDLCSHLIEYPESTAVATKVPCLRIFPYRCMAKNINMNYLSNMFDFDFYSY